MKFKNIEHFIKEISNNEFIERDSEVPAVVTKIKMEMHARGILHSAGTLSKISLFFEEEFKYRCTYIKDLLLNAIPKLNNKEPGDIIGKAKTLYQVLSFKEKDKLIASYKSYARETYEPLCVKMSEQISSRLDTSAQNFLQKNNTIIHYEYDAVVNREKDNKILFLKPSIMGNGIDVMALWERIKN